jgi:tetratricopeptide (TPR) repeat protein
LGLPHWFNGKAIGLKLGAAMRAFLRAIAMILHRLIGSASSLPKRASSRKPRGYWGVRPKLAHVSLETCASQGSAEARTLLGMDLARLGRLEAAVESYTAALAINPRSTQTNTKLADALQMLGRPGEAISH